MEQLQVVRCPHVSLPWELYHVQPESAIFLVLWAGDRANGGAAPDDPLTPAFLLQLIKLLRRKETLLKKAKQHNDTMHVSTCGREREREEQTESPAHSCLLLCARGYAVLDVRDVLETRLHPPRWISSWPTCRNSNQKNQELRAGDVHAPSKKEERDERGKGTSSDPSSAARSTANVGVAGGADVEREALVKREYAWCVVQVDRANFQLRNALWGRARSLALLSSPLSPSLGYAHAHTHTHNTHVKMWRCVKRRPFTHTNTHLFFAVTHILTRTRTQSHVRIHTHTYTRNAGVALGMHATPSIQDVRSRHHQVCGYECVFMWGDSCVNLYANIHVCVCTYEWSSSISYDANVYIYVYV